MDAVSLKLARNYTNEKLNSLPSNRPTKTVSFDGGIYSVGNDIVNGQVNACVIKGNTRTNLFPSISSRTGIESIATGVRITNLYSANTYLRVETFLKPNTTYTIRADVICVSGTPTLAWGQIYGFDSGDGNHSFVLLPPQSSTKIGATNTFTTPADLDSVRLIFYGISNGVTEFKNIVIEEGETVGEHYISTGTKSTNSVRVKSVGKNLLPEFPFRLGSSASYPYTPNPELTNYRAIGKNIILQAGTYNISSPVAISGGIFNVTTGSELAGYGIKPLPISFTLVDTAEVHMYFRNSAGPNAEWLWGDIPSAVQLQLEESSTATEYEPYKESIVNVNLPEPLRSLPNGVKDEVNVVEGKRVQRVGNKTNVASGTVINYTDMATAGQFAAWGSGEHVVGVKGDTLAFTATSLIYQLAEPVVTKLPAQAPLQVFENGTVYVEPMGDPAESTLTTVELTVPIAGGNKVGIATHDYAGAAADWVLSSNENKCEVLVVSNAGADANIIAKDRPGQKHLIKNTTDYSITIKKAEGTGVTIATGQKARVQHLGEDFEEI